MCLTTRIGYDNIISVMKMRLFIAVCFNEEVKDSLQKTTEQLKNMSVSGNFTKRENFHLTLHFIGETSKVSTLKNVLDAVDFSPFKMRISRCGFFRRDGGDIYWMGIEENSALDELHSALSVQLRKNGFKTESRPFRPHLTLGREVVITDRFDKRRIVCEENVVSVDSVHLMKSERIGGKLIYTSIYEKKANNR